MAASRIEFNVAYGREASRRLSEDLPAGTVLLVAPSEIRSLLGPRFAERRFVPFYRTDLEIESMDRDVDALPHLVAVVGLGGGVAMDIAKYVAWRREIPVWLLPSVMSVDACFSTPIAIRRDRRVEYVGECVPRLIYVDFALIQGAPAHLNRVGLGDLLSCHTALFDWRLAANAQPLVYGWSESIAAQARELLAGMATRIRDIHEVTEAGIRFVMEGYRWVAETVPEVGGCYYEEGSEHYFAYGIEHLTGQHFLHGQLVCLGVYLMSMLQRNDPDRVLALTMEAGVDIRPQALGITVDDLRRTLLELPTLARNEGYSYSILNEREITQDVVDELLETYRLSVR